MKSMPTGAPAAVAVALLLAAPAAAQDSALISANLLGENVLANAGDDKASADLNGEIDFRRNRLCYYLDTVGLDDATGASINQGGENVTGPEVIALTVPKNGDEACVDADNAVLRAIVAAPKEHYVEVRTAAHPSGAARGQIKD